MSVRVLQIGLGPIGQKVVQYVLERKGLKLVGAVDLDPAKVGRDAGEVCGAGRALRVPVVASLAEAIESAKARPDVAVLCTTSSLKKAGPQILEIVSRGLALVSTCEELSFPWKTAPALARRLDAAARKKKVAILGTGVNPGFLMDFLPLAMTGICRRVDSIRVTRTQDASIRRVPFQQKIGAGLTLAEFEAKKQAGTLRHVGLTESIHMIASRLGWRLTRTEDVLMPIVAEREIASGYMPIRAGMAAGVQQIGRGWVADQGQPGDGGRVARLRRGDPCGAGDGSRGTGRDGSSAEREVITLIFRAAVGEPGPADTIEIAGEQSFRSTIPGGINGDVATCAITVNAIPQVLSAPPGLRTMGDIAPVTCWA
jgi:4-hydroxy-tetrahydrodipicolinate reductase